MKLTLKLIFLISVLASICRADDYHYRSILIGEQAAGMGGAFVAIADDPSGIFYNPAGIVFGMENYFSLSANAYMSSTRKYENVLGGQDYNYNSSGLVPTFFGLTQSQDKNKWGFAVVVPNQTTMNQNDQITNISTTSGLANSLQRKFLDQDQTYLIGGAYAMELRKDFSIGLTLMNVYRSRYSVDNQLILFNGGRYVTEDLSLDQTTFGLYGKLGLQYMPMPKVSIGATIAKTTTYYSNRTIKSVSTDSSVATNPSINTVESNHNLLAPWEFAVGAAYFPTKRSLYSVDFYYYAEDTNFNDFQAQATWNIAMGTEQYITDNLVLRLGLYTNNANTPQLDPTKTNQLDHVDLTGITMAISMRSPGSSVTLGTTFSSGTGQGQAIGDTVGLNNIQERNIAIYLIGGYQL